jgi:hypothetical protein
MSKNIGAKVKRTFFSNCTPGPVDFYAGIVRSVTPSNKYDIMYDDNDSEEMSEREFAHYSLPPKAQAHAHITHLGGGLLRQTTYVVQLCRRSLLSSLVK